jgi:hypothetical protein
MRGHPKSGRDRRASYARPILHLPDLDRLVDALRIRADALLDHPTPEAQEDRHETVALARRLKALR